MKMNHIGMTVTDLAKAKKFYEDCPGLSPGLPGGRCGCMITNMPN